VGRQQRAFFVPSLFASYSFQRIVDEKLATASPPPLRNPKKDSWSLALRASFPLFSGTSRFHDLAEARAELDAALASREQVRQLVEQRTRVALAAVRASYPAIELQLLAAERMRQTFEILQNRYAVGRASLLELLEAQNQAFSLRLQAEISKYDYLADLTELQRSISLFEVLESPESMDLWFTELRQAAKDGS
jgi:outer membrane protein TolC